MPTRFPAPTTASEEGRTRLVTKKTRKKTSAHGDSKYTSLNQGSASYYVTHPPPPIEVSKDGVHTRLTCFAAQALVEQAIIEIPSEGLISTFLVLITVLIIVEIRNTTIVRLLPSESA